MKTTWTLKKFNKQIENQIRSQRSYNECDQQFRLDLQEYTGDFTLIRSSLFHAFQPALMLNSVRQAIDKPSVSKASLHLLWRVKAISVAAYFQYMEQLFRERSHPRIRSLGTYDINDIMILAASAQIFGTVEAFGYFTELAFRLRDADDRWVQRNAFTAGPVEPFLFNLCARYIGSETEIRLPNIASSTVFNKVLDSLRSTKFDVAAHDLIELKTQKMLSRAANNDLVFGLNTGVNFFLPFEYLFCIKVRERLGFSTQLHHHELLDLPVCQIIDDGVESGANSHIEKLIEKCKELLPTLKLDWEDRLKTLPATEFQQIIEE